MDFILGERSIEFGTYAAYLATVRDRLPAHVAAFASDERHFALNAPETLHDAWLVGITVANRPPGRDEEHRRTEVDVRLLGPFHDREHVLRYTGVRRYEVVGVGVADGHENMYAHEVRLAPDGVGLIHEYLFRGWTDGNDTPVLIECANFTHEMLPWSQTAG